MKDVVENSTPVGGIATALAKAQAQMGKALKQTANPHLRTKYADLSSVIDACLSALNDNGIALVQCPGTDAGERFVDTILIHGATGETLSCRVPLIVSKNDMQGYGSAVTYARRYGLMCICAIAPEDDDGTAAVAAAPVAENRTAAQPRPAARPATASAADDLAAGPGDAVAQAIAYLADATSIDDLAARWKNLPRASQELPAVVRAKDARKQALANAAPALVDDEIPY